MAEARLAEAGLVGGLTRIARPLFAAAVMACAVVGCASTPDGPVHVVRPGENLYRLSHHYGVSVKSIRRANGIDDVTQLQVGQQLLMPGSTVASSSRSLAPAGSSRMSSARAGSRGV